MKSMHDRKFTFSMVSLTKARPPRKKDRATLMIRDNLDSYIKQSGFLDNAPFIWIALSIRYGLKNDEKPGYQRISKKYGDLPVYIEIDTHELLEHKEDEATLYRIHYRPCLLALIDIAKKYKLDGSYFESELEKLNKGEIEYKSD